MYGLAEFRVADRLYGRGMAGKDAKFRLERERDLPGCLTQCCLIGRMHAPSGVLPQDTCDCRRKSLSRRFSAGFGHHQSPSRR
jgi:hypothetical protein